MITTERLTLRLWNEADFSIFAAINADERVCVYLPAPLNRVESDALAGKIKTHFDKHGYGLWAVEVTSGAPFIGFVGLSILSFEAKLTPCVEIGWRLGYEHWGKGYATEAAQAVLQYGFDTLQLEEIVSFTTEGNARSRSVIERLDMTHNPEDNFNHPSLPEEHPLSRHVLYRKGR